MECRFCREPAEGPQFVTPFGTFSMCQGHRGYVEDVQRRADAAWDSVAVRHVWASEDDERRHREVVEAMRFSARYGSYVDDPVVA